MLALKYVSFPGKNPCNHPFARKSVEQSFLKKDSILFVDLFILVTGNVGTQLDLLFMNVKNKVFIHESVRLCFHEESSSKNCSSFSGCLPNLLFINKSGVI